MLKIPPRLSLIALSLSLLLNSSLVFALDTAPTAQTKAVNQAVAQSPVLDWANQDDLNNATRGLIATDPGLILKDKTGVTIWSSQEYDSFLKGAAPATVNPSAWRHAVINNIHGLFEVTKGVYQVRGQSMSNMTIIESKTGYIVIDPNISPQNSQANMDLVYKNLGKRPVVALIYSHSHIDHFGGARGIVTDKEVAEGKVTIIAYKTFLENAVSENIIAGNAMSRRATYMYGHLLPKNPLQQIDAGEGKTTEMGDVSLIPPNHIIGPSGETLNIDGVKMIFEWAPGEAADELLVYFPEQKVLYSADNTVHSVQNVYTIRGAKTRDSLAWYTSLDKLLKYDQAEYLIQGHNWPVFGSAHIQDYIRNQRDALKYVHDQTLHLMNQGYTADEIANMITLPPNLANKWYLRPYYGNIKANVRAIFNQYLGWYDANPAHLDPPAPQEIANKMVFYMGGVPAVITKAQQDYDQGHYQWVVYVLDDVLRVDPNNKQAIDLAASAYTQLAYQAENLTWRNAYLSAARELTQGLNYPIAPTTASPDIIKNLSLDDFFSYMSIMLNGPRAFDQHITINWNFSDTQQHYITTVDDGILDDRSGVAKNPDVTITISRAGFNDLLLKQATIAQLLQAGTLKVEGNKAQLQTFLSLFDKFTFFFPLVTHPGSVDLPQPETTTPTPLPASAG